MGLKFLNKKGWHTGSLRNIENVWKAEQKHHAEQTKLDELRKQIHEERERDEFRALQIQAGLTPRQERLEFLYDSGLSVGKSSSEGFKELDAFPRADVASASASALASTSAPELSKSSAPGALFEEKPQSANDAWRKLHSDPLLMIRQREQEALAKIKNNPVKMAIIRKSVEAKNKNDDSFEGKHQKVKSKRRKRSSSKHHSDSDDDRHEKKERRKKEKKHKNPLDSDEDSREEKERRKKDKNKNEDHQESDKDSRHRARHHRHSHRDHEERHNSPSKQMYGRSYEDPRDETRRQGEDGERRSKRSYEKARCEDDSRDNQNDKYEYKGRDSRRDYESEDVERNKRRYDKAKHEENPNDKYEYKAKNDDVGSRKLSDSNHSGLPPKPDSYRRRGKATQLSEEERAARLREMQMDAEVHEEQRWKRLKKAEEDDVREASQANNSNRGSSFLDDVQKSVYGAEKGGSSTIEESVRRRTHFLQNSRNASEQNAFRR